MAPSASSSAATTCDARPRARRSSCSCALPRRRWHACSSSKSRHARRLERPSSCPAPSEPDGTARRPRVSCPRTPSSSQYHVHSHLDVFVDGTHVVVPAGLGIDITNPGVHTFTDGGQTSYGGIAVPCADAVHLAAAHPRRHRRPAHRVGDPQGQHARPVLHRVERAPRRSTCFATYCAPAKAVAVYVDGTQFTAIPRRSRSATTRRSPSSSAPPPAQIPSPSTAAQI